MVNNRIDFDFAKLLDNRVFADVYNDRYAAEEVTCTYDNYLGTEKYKAGELIDDGDYIHGKFYYAPTYGEVIDWLFDSRGIIIKFDPAFTMATKEKIAFYYTVYKLDKHECKLKELFGDKLYMSSFGLAMKDIVEKLIKEKYID